MIQWVIEKRKIADLKPHPRNPRKLSKHDYKHLTESIDRFGLIDKPVITQDGSIIGGHQRVQVLRKQKVKEVECWVPKGADVPAEQIDELMVRLNRNHGEFDFDILANDYEIEDLLNWGFEDRDLDIDAAIEDPPEKPPELVVKATSAKDFDKLEEAIKKVLKSDLIEMKRKNV